MSGDCFLMMDRVPGEAEDTAFTGAIEVLAWSWGAEAHEALGVGQARRSKADIRNFRFEHNIDSATTGLMTRCMTNDPIPKATLTQRRAGGAAAQQFIEIAFKQVRIVQVDLAMNPVGNGVATRATVVFSFERATLEYSPQGSTGATKGGRHTFEWIGGATK